MRIHLFEFEDLPWFPNVIRVGGTDYLRYLLIATDVYKPLIPLISESLSQTNETTIIDLCSGGGGYIEELFKRLSENSTSKISVILTDKFPNYEAYSVIKERAAGQIDFINYSVDAANVPKHLKGFRVMFSAIHHFQPEQVKNILQNAIDNNAPIGIFDGYEKNVLAFLSVIIFHPIAFLLFTPFFKPFSFSRLFFTYIIPLIPIYTVWDGCVSILRMYKSEELLRIANKTNANHYVWKAGKMKNNYGIHSTYLIGYPDKV
ncbi:MAG: class I SAM-dependent methyltransferase [Bacteroidia bacterium]